MIWKFTMQIGDVDIDRDNLEDALYANNCHDALLSVVDGKVFLDFDRDAPSREDAVSSAKGNVERAGATVVAVVFLP